MQAFAILMCLLLGQATPPVAPPKVSKDPVVVLSGPTQRLGGRSVLLKATIVGDDPQFSCVPANANWNVIQFFKSNEIGITFDPDKEGVYAFAVAANANGKTAVAVHLITIGNIPTPTPGPTPGPPLDAFAQKLQDALKADIAAGVGTDKDRQALLAAYKQGVTQFIPNSKTNADLMSQQKELNETMVAKGRLPQLRAVIAQQVVADMGNQPTNAIDSAKATATWNKIVTALGAIS